LLNKIRGTGASVKYIVVLVLTSYLSGVGKARASYWPLNIQRISKWGSEFWLLFCGFHGQPV